jgi:hypothetical protein
VVAQGSRSFIPPLLAMLPLLACAAMAVAGAEGPPLPAAASGSPTLSSKRTPVPYVDRLIEGAGRDAEESDAAALRPRDDAPGLRSWSIETRGEHRETNDAGHSNAAAVAFRYARETEQYGDLTLIGQASRFDPAATDPTGRQSKADFTLFHDQFAIDADFMASSALGVIRPVLPAWLSTSYRVTLAPSLLNGATTTVSGPGSDFRLAIGELGRYSGFGIQQFERTSGHLASASASRRMGGDWLAGASAVAVRGNATIPDHGAVSLAVQRDLGPMGANVKAQLSASDNGGKAAWIDANLKEGRLNQRFGAFVVDPDFLFGESATARDSRGAYWRGDYRIGGNFFGAGAEISQENLRRDPSRGGSDNASVFGNMTLKLDRTTQLGGGLSYRNERPRVESGIERDVLQANAAVTHSGFLGQARVDWNATVSRRPGAPGDRASTVNWIQDWPRIGPLAGSTLLGYSSEDQSDRRVRRKTASLSLRGDFARGLRWDTTFTFVDSADSQGGDRNYNATVGIEWLPIPEWTVHLSWYRNRIQPGPDNPLAPFVSDNSVLLGIRYDASAGTPYPRTAETGRGGTGTVSGSVFFDENNDGVRQANERGAPNVIVILDERRSANTDPEGRYTFAMVPAGRHRIRIIVERLPLPWGLEDETPREVSVEVRGESRLDIGLGRIRP